MKALYLYSDKTGLSRPKNFQERIIRKLSLSYDLTAKATKSREEFISECQNSISNGYEVVIISGGDGTFNMGCSAIAELPKEKRPIIGYVPTGTCNDSGKTLGIKGIRKALKILKNKKIVDYDICKVNDQYFTFVCAIGQYADIAYITERREKKHFGRLSYYRIAIKEAFQKKKVHAVVECNNKKYEVITPFVLVMSGSNVGGFKVNFKKSYNDGLFDIYLTKPGLFNGLLHYLFFKARTLHVKTSAAKIHTDQTGEWCIDGERGMKGDIEIECLKSHLRVIGLKK